MYKWLLEEELKQWQNEFWSSFAQKYRTFWKILENKNLFNILV